MNEGRTEKEPYQVQINNQRRSVALCFVVHTRLDFQHGSKFIENNLVVVTEKPILLHQMPFCGIQGGHNSFALLAFCISKISINFSFFNIPIQSSHSSLC